jgi:hypothetical protein
LLDEEIKEEPNKQKEPEKLQETLQENGISSSDSDSSDEDDDYDDDLDLSGNIGSGGADTKIMSKSFEKSENGQSSPSNSPTSARKKCSETIDTISSIGEEKTKSSANSHKRSKSENDVNIVGKLPIKLPIKNPEKISGKIPTKHKMVEIEEKDDLEKIVKFDIDSLNGEEFRFGMVVVHDSREYNANETTKKSISRVTENGNTVYDYNMDINTVNTLKNNNKGVEDSLLLAGDTRIRVKHNSKELFHFWFHTNFISENNTLVLKKNELDCKSIKKDKRYSSDYGIELTFEKINPGPVDSSQIGNRERSISKFGFRRVPSAIGVSARVINLEEIKMLSKSVEDKLNNEQIEDDKKNDDNKVLNEGGGGGKEETAAAAEVSASKVVEEGGADDNLL